MSTSALITMISAWAVITYFMLRFFIKVLTTPPKPEPDSYSDNDDVKRP
jgi:hypothetical protein